MDRPWIAFFSQSGTEIIELCKLLNRKPDLIVTNNDNRLPERLNVELNEYFGGSLFGITPNRPTLKDYIDVLKSFKNPIITLHGWLRIIPEDICNEYEIYNGHPGYIIGEEQGGYGDLLKGKDPQRKAYELNLPYSGAVLHRVTGVLDSGEIVSSIMVPIGGLELVEVFRTLRKSSLDLWFYFLKKL